MKSRVLCLALALLPGVAFAAAQTVAPVGNTQTNNARKETLALQQPSPTPNPEPAPAQESVDEVVRINSKLVQLDLVVTDKNGKQVTDLKAEDFDIFEDGHRQPLTHFSYIFTGPPSGPLATDANPATAASGTNPQPAAPRRERVRRTIAIVVDDLGLSFMTTVTARNALRKFIDEQIQPGDLVALIRTGGEVGSLQQFTSDKRLLLAAVERVRWNSCSRGGITLFAAVGHPFAAPICSYDTGPVSVAALGSVISGMRELPGRKSLIFFADGFPIVKPDEAEASGLTNPLPRPMIDRNLLSGNIETPLPLRKKAEPGMYFDPVRMLSEMAIRASVVVYSVDTRGLAAFAPTAADDMGGVSGDGFRLLENSRSALNGRGRAESATLAETTGGFFVQNSNNLNIGLNRIMEDQKGYYLIGYRPGSDTFDRRFHRLTARLKTRSDLSVRTREGFYGLTDDDARPAKRTAVDRFQLALMSPFGASDIDVRLTPLFTSLPEVGPVLRSRLHINTQNLSFKEEPGGWRSAQLVLRALLLGDNGRIVDEHRRAFTVRLRGATLARVQSQGFDYVFDMPAKKPGAYQFRIAIIDTVSSRVGSAGQYVEVPNLKKKQLALSGIALNEAESGEPTPATVDAAGPQTPRDVGANAAARRFQRNTSLNYEYMVFNPGEPTGERLMTLVQLFHDGKLVFEQEAPAEILQKVDATRVLAGSRLRLGTDLAPGEYVLQIIVTDPTAKKGQGTATESADFEIIE